MGLLILLAFLFPGVVLLLAVGMEHIERPLRNDDVRARIEDFLDNATPEELETFVSEGYGSTVDRFWRRQHRAQPTEPPPAPRYAAGGSAKRIA